jgi:uncharacterized protein (TIGR03083 family)
MINKAIEALRADRGALLEITAGLRDADWKEPSGCAGWTVQDVVAHMGALYWVVVDPSVLPDAAGLPTEQAQDVYVEARRSWSPDRVRSDYEAVSGRALDILQTFEGQEAEVPLGDLGTYPMSVLPCAFAFDHYIHIRSDLFAPRGPLRGPVPASDELRLEPSLDWIAAALPQQNPSVVAGLSGTVEIDVTGPGGRLLRVGSGPTTVEIRSDSESFARWITHRATWDDAGAAASGEGADVERARQLRVF